MVMMMTMITVTGGFVERDCDDFNRWDYDGDSCDDKRDCSGDVDGGDGLNLKFISGG